MTRRLPEPKWIDRELPVAGWWAGIYASDGTSCPPSDAVATRHGGWHRLRDEWAARVVSAVQVRLDELVFDIGAGEGALTAHLVRAGRGWSPWSCTRSVSS